jgi:hypothetical protein
MKVRDQHPERFHDVFFNDFARDSIGVVRGIYRRFGLALDDAVEQKMRNWLDAHTQSRPGFHQYARAVRTNQGRNPPQVPGVHRPLPPGVGIGAT